MTDLIAPKNVDTKLSEFCSNVISLQKLCSNSFVDNIELFTKLVCKDLASTFNEQPVDSVVRVLRDESIRLPPRVSELLLSTLAQTQKLDKLNMHIFNSTTTSLRHVTIDCDKVTSLGLRALHGHAIAELELLNTRSHLEFILCPENLAECTYHSLKALRIFNSSGDERPRHGIVMEKASLDSLVDFARKYRHLHTLNLCNVRLNDYGLHELCEVLPRTIRDLDISENPVTDISPLRKVSSSLQHLTMFDLYCLKRDSCRIIIEMPYLVSLDLSCEPENHQLDTFLKVDAVPLQVQELLLSQCNELSNLKYLELAGREKDIKVDDVMHFLDSHPNLRFIGLIFTSASSLPSVLVERDLKDCYQHLEIASDDNLGLLFESLRRYSHRTRFAQKLLCELFRHDLATESLMYEAQSKSRVVLIVCKVMKSHLKDVGVQMAATACLFKLTREDGPGGEVAPECLSLVTDLIIQSMEYHRTNQQLQKNSLLTICTDRILTDVEFDRFRCCKVVMDVLCVYHDDSMTRMCVAIISILAAKIKTEETTKLAASERYMSRLIQIAKKKAEVHAVDSTMKFTLSALWNLTDESPEACQCFKRLGGIELAIQCHQNYKSIADLDQRLEILTKVVGFLNNVAEVKELRCYLITEEFLTIMREALTCERLDFAYFSAGILSNLVCDRDNPAWSALHIPIYEHIQNEMIDEISKWQQPETAMVAYRCFRPFHSLLEPGAPMAVKLWALWAIEHVCSKCPERYIQNLIEERIDVYVAVLKDSDKNPNIVSLATRLCSHINEFHHRNADSTL